MQETVCRALAKHAIPGNADELRTWLRTIGGLVLLEQYREPRGEGLDMDAILVTVERSQGPDQALEQKENAALVQAVLSSLRPIYREVIVLRFVKGLSVAELAVQQHLTQRATRSLLERARNAFRAQARHHGLIGSAPPPNSEGKACSPDGTVSLNTMPGTTSDPGLKAPSASDFQEFEGQHRSSRHYLSALDPMLQRRAISGNQTLTQVRVHSLGAYLDVEQPTVMVIRAIRSRAPQKHRSVVVQSTTTSISGVLGI